ncbi:FeoA family protein [Ammoniphilus resinae]|uniref:Ferrous iron transport protein A n=1 Tax=Ammoniphilus resinae TaxID=861532 RepID=A0ABS4GPC2_9BACL|nr:FeoA family protein [Ammoniphilus resinae]MBP1932109.1 ferrous iron transport protein A [Ammoniphilus resinae]
MVLSEMKQGSIVKILNTDRVSEIVRRRLIDLGMMEGATIRIKRILPFGGPFAVEICGQWIGIRRCEAKSIEVEWAS